MPRTAVSVPFSVQRGDQARLRRLVDRFGGGSRTEFLRVAMERMEVAERAEDLRWLQAYGTRKTAEAGRVATNVGEVVRQRLNRARGRKGPSQRAQQLVKRVLAEPPTSR